MADLLSLKTSPPGPSPSNGEGVKVSLTLKSMMLLSEVGVGAYLLLIAKHLPLSIRWRGGRGVRFDRSTVECMKRMLLACSLLLLIGCDVEAGPPPADFFDAAQVVDASDAASEVEDISTEQSSVDAWLRDGAVDPVALSHWLLARQYREWDSTATIAPSPQGGSRVFVSASLAGSLAVGADTHPLEVIAVRELYEDDLFTPRAINVTVKLGGEEGAQWLWYELTELTPGASPSVFERAAPGCLACHAGAVDRVMSDWPLR